MPVKYLTVDQLIEAHDVLIAEFGGSTGIRSLGQLASATMQAQQSAFGEDAYPSVPEKAAAYGYFIAEAQAFVDGNKRTAARSRRCSRTFPRRDCPRTARKVHANDHAFE
jgi:death-on-curing protein